MAHFFLVDIDFEMSPQFSVLGEVEVVFDNTNDFVQLLHGNPPVAVHF